MDGISRFFDHLYLRFFLRDFVGKIVPGAMILVTLVSSFPSLMVDIQLPHLGDAANVVMFAGFAWLTGITVQGFGRALFGRMRGAAERNRGNFLEFLRISSDDEKTHHERFAVLKESTGNAATALLLILLVVSISFFIRWHSGEFSNSTFDWIPIIMCVGAVIVTVLGRIDKLLHP